MQCLEIVSVRLASIEAFQEALGVCQEILRLAEPGQCDLYRSIGPDTDLSVHIRWGSGALSHEKSRVGFELVRGMSRYGLISHNLWAVQPAKPGIPRPR